MELVMGELSVQIKDKLISYQLKTRAVIDDDQTIPMTFSGGHHNRESMIKVIEALFDKIEAGETIHKKG